MKIAFVRPNLYAETLDEQWDRLQEEHEQERLNHTLYTIKAICLWFETQQILGRARLSEVDCAIEAKNRCFLNSVAPEHIPVAVGMITEIYMQRG